MQKNFNKKQNFNSQTLRNDATQFDAKFCRYCKKQGHNIEECRKREYNRKRNQNQTQNQVPGPSNSHNPSNVHLNSTDPQVDASPVEVNISIA